MPYTVSLSIAEIALIRASLSLTVKQLKEHTELDEDVRQLEALSTKLVQVVFPG